MVMSNVESVPAIVLETPSQQCLMTVKLILKVKVINYSVVNVH